MLIAERTWLVTFTLGPQARAALRVARAANPQALGEAPQHLSRLFDRLRHSHGVRYLCVREDHKSGEPHWHALIHQGARKLRYRDLRARWGLGFFHAKLVGKRVGGGDAASYVAKYATKANQGRVRASRGYGTYPQGAATALGAGA